MNEARRTRFEREMLPQMQAVYSAAWRLTDARDAARDLAQDALLRPYRVIDQVSIEDLEERYASAFSTPSPEVAPAASVWTMLEVDQAMHALPGASGRRSGSST